MSRAYHDVRINDVAAKSEPAVEPDFSIFDPVVENGPARVRITPAKTSKLSELLEVFRKHGVKPHLTPPKRRKK